MLLFCLGTGGTVMGLWADPSTAVITAAIGPGPNALHQHRNFLPDQDWQLMQIAEHYEESGRRETYLGDWHSHPNASSGDLSWLDRRVLRRIIRAPEARCVRPLAAVVWGKEEDWQTEMYRAALRRRSWIWSCLDVE